MKHLRSALISSTLFLGGVTPAFSAPIVHPGDMISVDVLNYAAVIDDSQGRLKGLDAGSVTVAADGSISIPVAGTLHVAGKTVRQISDD